MNPNVPKTGVDQNLEDAADKILSEAGYDANGLNPAEEKATSDAWQQLGVEGDIRDNAKTIAAQSGAPVESIESAAPEMATKIVNGEQPVISMDNPEAIGDHQPLEAIGEDASDESESSGEKTAESA